MVSVINTARDSAFAFSSAIPGDLLPARMSQRPKSSVSQLSRFRLRWPAPWFRAQPWIWGVLFGAPDNKKIRSKSIHFQYFYNKKSIYFSVLRIFLVVIL